MEKGLDNGLDKGTEESGLPAMARPVILEMQAYQTKVIPGVVKMDANENPFPWPERMRELLLTQNLTFNRYPDGAASELKQALSAYTEVGPRGILTGNGGDELIQLTLITFGGPGRAIVLHPPTFSMYYAAAKLTDTRVVDVPLLNGVDLDLEGMLAAGKGENVGVILVCNPNNPTGNCFSREEILRLVEETGKLVIVDEAYAEFSGQSMIGELEGHPNLLILRTFSKAFGMAGLRLGYLLGSPELIDLLNRARQPFNVNAFSQKAGVIALQYLPQFQAQVKVIKEETSKLYRALTALPQVKVFPTQANFILFLPPDPDLWAAKLLEQGFLVRNMGNLAGLGKSLRVSAGQPEENRRLIAALEEISRENQVE